VVERPRLLLIPAATELEWLSKPLLEEWAEAASFDPPWVGGELPEEGLPEAVARRGLGEVDRLGWERYVVVGDELGVPAAILVAQARPHAVRGLALGHACLSFRQSGERAPINREVWAGFLQLIKVDYRSFVRANVQIWDPRRSVGEGPLDEDELVERWIERIPEETAIVLAERFVTEVEAAGDWEDELRELDVPFLFAQHQGCVATSAEGFEDAVAAFPEAEVARCPVSPSASPEFAHALQDFCSRLPG
jgi:pimeloyl-ACP methyl ester carboxylesterase